MRPLLQLQRIAQGGACGKPPSVPHTADMSNDVVDLEQVDRTNAAIVGGKGANLGELMRIDGVVVPPGFCVTAPAFRRIVNGHSAVSELLERLASVDADDARLIRNLSADLRRAIEGIAMPDDVASEITGALGRFGPDAAYAVRSSATAEDSPTASFAGQQDSYLDITGAAAILRDISRCWASLFTERAVTYRLSKGLDHRTAEMAVVVQRMVFPDAAGVLFTADPFSSNRRIAAIEAVPAIGEALVSGRVNPDVVKVRDGEIVARTVAGDTPSLTDAQAIRLAGVGRRIEAHFQHPQDIEWCLVDDDFQIVQSRPITTLFPIPARRDPGNHVYLSVGHQQMMTDPMKPLGLSVWQLTAMAPMHEAGGRLFVDVTTALGSAASRTGLLDLMGRSDPLMRDALQTVLDRDGFLPAPDRTAAAVMPVGSLPASIETDPAIVTGLIDRSQRSIETLKRDIRATSGAELFDFLLEAFQEHKRVLSDPLSIQAILAGMQATWWLNEHLLTWLGEKNAADVLTRSAPHNVTSEMGLALLDVADVIRPHPDVIAFLRTVVTRDPPGDDFLTELADIDGGPATRDAIRAYLDRYGMRCVGEIDITRPRWSEQPGTLLPVILGNVAHFMPGAARRLFEQGRQEAMTKERDVLQRLRELPDDRHKAEETTRMIDRVRTFIGYREYPKYAIISRYFSYKQALMKEAGRLARDGVISAPEDVFFLTFAEFHDAVRTGLVDRALIGRRRDDFATFVRRLCRQGFSRPTARRSPGPTDGATCRPARSWVCPCRPGSSRGGPG